MSDLEKNTDKFENLNRDTFIKTIRVVAESIKDSKDLLNKTGIMEYFKELHLTEPQQELIYDYLKKMWEDRSALSPKLKVQEQSEITLHQSGQDKQDEMTMHKPHFFQMYLKEMEEIKPCTPKEEEILYDQLLAGNREAMQKLSDQWLPRIYRMAKECVTVEKELADAVQEGNLAVFMSLNHMLGSGRNVDFKFVLEQAAKEAIEAYLCSAAEAADMDQSLIAKAALVYEAQKVLAQEFQRMPTIEELEQYTRISAEELEDLLALSETK